MESFKLYNKRTGECLLKELKVADTFGLRLKGLMGKTIDESQGLLITPCNSIHCMFMKMPIDVLFLDDRLNVLHKISGMKPWRVSPLIRGSRAVVEGTAGVFQNVAVGDQLSLKY